jgi:pantoate ligase/cytidylate kinase
MLRSPIVAIDGPAGAGKSTVTRLVARQLGLVYLDTGAMYRAVTWLVQHQGLAAEESPELAALLGQLDLRLEAQAEGDQRVLLNGQDVTAVIRTATVTAGVSAVAALPSVRAALTAQQQRFGSSGGLVAEGRDIGTAVFPQAELKVFLTATVAERARRRAADLAARGLPVPALGQLEQEIAERDGRDSSRAVAPLCRAEDALELVSDGLTIDGVVQLIVAWFHERVPLEAMASLRATAVDPAAGPAGAEAS